MALSIYLQLAVNPGGPDLTGESSVTLPSGPQSPLGPATPSNQGLIELVSADFDMEQTLNIGSAGGGAGAGKATFNPLSVVKRIDKTSPHLFEMLCSGTPLKTATLYIAKAGGGGAATAMVVLKYVFSLVAVKTVSTSFSAGSDGPMETVTFEYGGVQQRYAQQNPDGTMGQPVGGGWNRVTNMRLDPNVAM